jgi:hypothetical protein
VRGQRLERQVPLIGADGPNTDRKEARCLKEKVFGHEMTGKRSATATVSGRRVFPVNAGKAQTLMNGTTKTKSRPYGSKAERLYPHPPLYIRKENHF